MHLTELKVFHFRNLSDATLTFSPRVNLVVGRNGQGKTNLLEAIALLSRGRSFRTTDAKELVRWDERAMSVFGRAEESLGAFEVGVSFENGERTLYFNGNEQKSISDFIARLLVVSFTPADIEIVKGGPQERRRFLDSFTTLVFPRTMQFVVAYQKVIKHKNFLLKQGHCDLRSIEPWNKLLVESALPIVKARRNLIAQLELLVQNYYQRLAHDDGAVNLDLKETLQGDTTEHALAYLQDHFAQEVSMRSCLYGPHRDDLRMHLGGRSARHFGSQGQARSLVLALKIGALSVIEQERGESPIVLLDDVDAELDAFRRAAFFDALYSDARQFVITGTELERDSLLLKRDHQVVRVERGTLKNERPGE